MKPFPLLCLATTVCAMAQSSVGTAVTPPAGDPAAAPVMFKAFEVATIKPNAANDNRIMIRMAPGGRFTASGITVRTLIAQAYGLRDFQISGGPAWISNERFDINAKGPDGMPDRVPPEVLRPMLRALLEERFGLKTHSDSKEMPIYALVEAKGGNKLVVADKGQPNPMMRMGRGQLSGKRIPMTMFAQQLAQQLGRTVVDKTGLKDNYDIELEWTPEPGQMMGGPGGPPPPGGHEGPPPSAPADGPTIFTALQEKLGLRLESTKGPVETLVIDSVTKPSEN
jgi:uncharacterized protein (TIGR03435 family)